MFVAGGEGKDGERKATEQEIIWDDEAVEALLDRSTGVTGGGQPADGEKPKEHWANEYLGSFKVAQYVTREADEQPEEEEVAHHFFNLLS